MYWVIALLGVISIIAPFAFGYTDNNYAFWTNLIMGFVLVSVSVFERLANDRENWEYWLAGAVGALMIVAPFVLGFSSLTAAYLTTMVIGLVAVITSMYKISSGRPTLMS